MLLDTFCFYKVKQTSEEKRLPILNLKTLYKKRGACSYPRLKRSIKTTIFRRIDFFFHFYLFQRRISYSTLPVNRRRNRYQDVIPFDATRVVLEKPLSIESNGELSNYINASLISDLSGQVHSPL